jgi:MoaA/NifB/PqqE/SkfB family radical SAM enzyme
MCYQSAGPKGSDVWGKASLETAEIETVIRNASRIDTLGKRFHLSGGEAFIRRNHVIRLFAVARDAGFTNISTTTNAFWARSKEQGLETARRCREAGLTSMEISWDYWHQPYVSADAVSNCLEACREYEISTNLRLLTTKSHSAREALSTLRPEALRVANEISSCPVFPTGRAKFEVDAADIYRADDLEGSCHHMLNLTVNALGNVYPCCAGADQTDGLSFGNIRESSIEEIAGYMQHSPLLRVLVFQGIGAFRPILEQAGVDVGDDFANICHMCFEIFSRADRYKVIQDYFDREVSQALGRALSMHQNQSKEPDLSRVPSAIEK